MKKIILISAITAICIAVIVTVIYIYLNFPRKIEIYKEYQTYSKRETFGMFWHIIENDEIRSHLAKRYEVGIPKIDFNKHYLLWSDGRRIKEINYTIGSKFKWCFNVPKGIAVFVGPHHPHTAFFYKIEKIYVQQD